ncbi:hypothetical protein ABZX98_25735 [Streptomyces sp. NPDC002992]
MPSPPNGGRHSPCVGPVPEPTLEIGVTALLAAAAHRLTDATLGA